VGRGRGFGLVLLRIVYCSLCSCRVGIVTEVGFVCGMDIAVCVVVKWEE
jgi:hypothetical protein